VPYFFDLGLTRAAIATGTHFCDLGGNNKVVDRQIALDARARRAGVAVTPDCGLAPGMVSTLAADGFARLDRTRAIHLRVGGLPRRPGPPMNYGLVFSANGLINEYVEPCLVLRRGRPAEVEPLADVEAISFPAPFGRLEAFNTSGGSSRLPLTFAGKVQTLDYKTIRYPGHSAQVRLLHELGLTSPNPVRASGVRVSPRRLLIERLEAVLPFERDDVVLLRVDVLGTRKGRRRRIRYELIDRADRRTGLTAMMRTTGFAAAVVALMLARGQVMRRGVFTGEHGIDGHSFISELRSRGLDLRVKVS
jgi:lysine 6-dehydrogenase